MQVGSGIAADGSVRNSRQVENLTCLEPCLASTPWLIIENLVIVLNEQKYARAKFLTSFCSVPIFNNKKITNSWRYQSNLNNVNWSISVQNSLTTAWFGTNISKHIIFVSKRCKELIKGSSAAYWLEFSRVEFPVGPPGFRTTFFLIKWFNSHPMD